LGVAVTVRTPATSANLGPGFDSLGLALALHDEVEVEATAEGGTGVQIDGEGAGSLPGDDRHLVVRAVLAGLAYAGVDRPGLRLRCRNAIPHGRGLGSSASAAVAGLMAARGLLSDPSPLDNVTLLRLATDFEGHPDNAAATLLGGFTISWTGPGSGGPLPDAQAVVVPVHPDVRVVACVPDRELATSVARGMLPVNVTHDDAAFNAGRAALLVEALGRRPELLLAATDDRLHQRQRASAMPGSARLVRALRSAGVAAVVSGAGPAVLVLGVGDGLPERVRAVLRRIGEQPGDEAVGRFGHDVGRSAAGWAGWLTMDLAIDTFGAMLITQGGGW
jgi:homoserine kinase